MVHNGGWYVPIWLKYYRQFFADEDIYIINHGSTDGSITDEIRKRHKVSDLPFSGVISFDFLVANVSMLHAKLEGLYDYIVIADIDELIVADPKYFKDLREYLDQSTLSHISVGTRSLIQEPEEKELDLSKPILPQRKVWFSEPDYEKPCINKVTPIWTVGFHYLCTEPGTIVDGMPSYKIVPKVYDDRVLLIHLNRMDVNLSRKNHKNYQKDSLPEKGPQWSKFLPEDDFDFWYYGTVYKKEVIPKRFKHIF